MNTKDSVTGEPWSPLSIEEVRGLFDSIRAPWWIAGGVAIDLFLGRQTRVHEDIDVQITRGTEVTFAQQLAGWELYTATDGTLSPWSEPDNANVIWCRPNRTAPWALELLVNDVSDGRWTYRRDRRVSRSIAELGDRTPEGVPFLRPEIQLLYKSKNVRPKDEADFRAASPLLDDSARSWLRVALTIIDPTHPWLSTL